MISDTTILVNRYLHLCKQTEVKPSAEGYYNFFKLYEKQQIMQDYESELIQIQIREEEFKQKAGAYLNIKPEFVTT